MPWLPASGPIPSGPNAAVSFMTSFSALSPVLEGAASLIAKFPWVTGAGGRLPHLYKLPYLVFSVSPLLLLQRLASR